MNWTGFSTAKIYKVYKASKFCHDSFLFQQQQGTSDIHKSSVQLHILKRNVNIVL